MSTGMKRAALYVFKGKPACNRILAYFDKNPWLSKLIAVVDITEWSVPELKELQIEAVPLIITEDQQRYTDKQALEYILAQFKSYGSSASSSSGQDQPSISQLQFDTLMREVHELRSEIMQMKLAMSGHVDSRHVRAGHRLPDKTGEKRPKFGDLPDTGEDARKKGMLQPEVFAKDKYPPLNLEKLVSGRKDFHPPGTVS